MMNTVRTLMTITSLAALSAIGCASASETGGAGATENIPEAETVSSGELALTTTENSGWVPYDGVATNSCNGENIATRGFTRTVVRTTDDGAGNVRVQVNGAFALNGVGSTTGALYRSFETYKTVDIATAEGTGQFSYSARGVFRTTSPTGADLRYRTVLKGEISAAGDITILVDKVVIDC